MPDEKIQMCSWCKSELDEAIRELSKKQIEERKKSGGNEMNRQQKAYALAKAKKETLFELQREHETDFLKRSGYTNPDGEVPTEFYMIDDEAEFTRLCAEFDQSPLNLTPRINEAVAALRMAEDALIDYALSITPAGPREILNRNRDKYSIRKKLLDIAFRLDTRTVKGRR